ncbi:hypothetical protein LEP1GSC055_1467 [Leptospira borgpetersenii str. Brem 307]|uniref:Uncharacterized protein n=1 Tax=Leptospira borgpetersenii str. Brem 328 TaxID=1049780 RepID=A0ABC9SKM8_LEPBO|nr:hypothetical protein LEP1GSC055_1467 [Leptospira borgpetersenii str. Brem 307]EMN18258.1 hypothetical protein LEP1GSC056_1558 [Leptospira borgpetersenii str. Brem 328]
MNSSPNLPIQFPLSQTYKTHQENTAKITKTEVDSEARINFHEVAPKLILYLFLLHDRLKQFC